MKALTLTQPWATLVAIGAKKIETRSWRTAYRGPLAIHAAKTWTMADRKLLLQKPFYTILKHQCLPRGAVIAIAFLDDCCQIVPRGRSLHLTLDPAMLTDNERAFGNYDRGRWAFSLTGATLLTEPVPVRGYHRLWEWDTQVYDAETHKLLQLEARTDRRAAGLLEDSAFLDGPWPRRAHP